MITINEEKQSHELSFCSDCSRLAIALCTLCSKYLCSQHQRKVSNYAPQGRVMMCQECAEAFMAYQEEMVQPRFALG
jgi:hypothetical protein